MDKEVIKKEIQEVLGDVLNMFDKTQIPNFENFETVIRDIANVTVDLYCHKKVMELALGGFDDMLNEYKEELTSAVEKQHKIFEEYKQEMSKIIEESSKLNE